MFEHSAPHASTAVPAPLWKQCGCKASGCYLAYLTGTSGAGPAAGAARSRLEQQGAPSPIWSTDLTALGHFPGTHSSTYFSFR